MKELVKKKKKLTDITEVPNLTNIKPYLLLFASEKVGNLDSFSINIFFSFFFNGKSRHVEIPFRTCPRTSIQTDFTCSNMIFLCPYKKKAIKMIQSDKDVSSKKNIFLRCNYKQKDRH